jgi:hypothetical protein
MITVNCLDITLKPSILWFHATFYDRRSGSGQWRAAIPNSRVDWQRSETFDQSRIWN